MFVRLGSDLVAVVRMRNDKEFFASMTMDERYQAALACSQAQMKLLELKSMLAFNTFPHCTGPCDQGRKICPCPMECQMPEYTPNPYLFAQSRLASYAVGLALAIGLVVAVIAMLKW